VGREETVRLTLFRHRSAFACKSVRVRAQCEDKLAHSHIMHGTHCMFAMSAKASGGIALIPLPERSSTPPCVGQEPDRTNGAPLESPLKLQPPNPTVQGKAEALLDAARSPNSAGNICQEPHGRGAPMCSSPSSGQPATPAGQLSEEFHVADLEEFFFVFFL
jgi:hypothetical protein